MKKYTLEEIKKAFWKEFHESGELWFCYGNNKEENTEYTEEYWNEFVDELNNIAEEK
jgi:hypothetical protein